MTKQDREKIINQLKKALAKQPVKLAYLYGSYARGQETPKSDIDIAVIMNENSKKADYEIANELHLSINNGSLINVVTINEKTNSIFLHSILKTRVVLISKNERERVSFEVKTTKKYWDDEYLRKKFRFYQKKSQKEDPYRFKTATL